MGKDKHERDLRRRRSKDAVLGSMTDAVLGPKDNGHKKVIENLEKSLDAAYSARDTSQVGAALPAQGSTQERTTKVANDAPETAGTKTRNLRYSHKNAAGEAVDFGPDVREIVYTMDKDPTKVVSLRLDEIITDKELLERIAQDYPMAICGLAFGFKTTMGNAVTSVKSGDVGEMHEAILERKSTIVDDKEWREGGTRGPSPKAVLEAMLAVYAADRGRAASDEKREQFKALIKEKGAKAVLATKKIAAEFEAAKLRKQEENLRKLQSEAASEQAGEVDALFAD